MRMKDKDDQEGEAEFLRRASGLPLQQDENYVALKNYSTLSCRMSLLVNILDARLDTLKHVSILRGARQALPLRFTGVNEMMGDDQKKRLASKSFVGQFCVTLL